MSLQELNIRLKDYFIDLGFQYVELPLVHDSDIFYETSGEEIRSQMYSFIDGSGKEKCLRPDMTIPTCQSFIKSDDKINEFTPLLCNTNIDDFIMMVLQQNEPTN